MEKNSGGFLAAAGGLLCLLASAVAVSAQELNGTIPLDSILEQMAPVAVAQGAPVGSPAGDAAQRRQAVAALAEVIWRKSNVDREDLCRLAQENRAHEVRFLQVRADGIYLLLLAKRGATTAEWLAGRGSEVLDFKDIKLLARGDFGAKSAVAVEGSRLVYRGGPAAAELAEPEVVDALCLPSPSERVPTDGDNLSYPRFPRVR